MKQIIVLESEAKGTDRYVRFAFWFPVPSATQAFYANPALLSAHKQILPAELAALQSGQVVEVVNQFMIPTGWGKPEIKTELMAEYTQQATAFAAAVSSPYVNYGIVYDGTTWSA